ncbi:outer membrane protein [Methylocapsa acidiphila]|uniref:outer membrane protein n=1 Tax=Methylocapsa acidiphila TaxID=133552 RepID=UPI00041A563E|nr:outer membrane protein [Methylocapsa acidiphila]
MFARVLLSTTAILALVNASNAADLPVAAPPPAAPAFTWAGVYVGGQIGYAWAQDNSAFSNWYAQGTGFGPTAFGDATTTPEGAIGGAHIGNNWQINQWVLGLEGEVDGTNLKKSTQPVYFVQATTSAPIQGAILGRVGYAIDRTLIYATGGGAFSWLKNKYVLYGSEGDFGTTLTGWTAGGGIEYAVNDNWSVRAEYRYTKFGYLSDGPIVYPGAYQSHHWTENQVKIGFSYKFSPKPAPGVVAKY